MNVYEKVIVIGYGKITGEIIRLVHRYQEEYEYTTIYIEHEAEVFGTSRKICTDLDIDCYKIEDKKELFIQIGISFFYSIISIFILFKLNPLNIKDKLK